MQFSLVAQGPQREQLGKPLADYYVRCIGTQIYHPIRQLQRPLGEIAPPPRASQNFMSCVMIGLRGRRRNAAGVASES